MEINKTKKIPISVVIITKNEEQNLTGCMESVKWAKEIVIVDGGSTDRTVEIAKKYTDKILTRQMDIEGRHRNFAYSQATQDWILSLDADERVSSELAEELKQVVTQSNSPISAYSIPIKTYIGNRWLKSAGYYPARKLRLHRKGKFRYEESGVHPRAYLDGKEKNLNGDIIHYGYRNFTHMIEKLNNQTTLEAEKWISENRKVGFLKIIYKMIERFLRNYFGKKGYADGFMGFFMSAQHALYQLLTYAKYWEIKKHKQKA
jgi:glycosyltransferase involved in cell wall biosynthesis